MGAKIKIGRGKRTNMGVDGKGRNNTLVLESIQA